MLKNLHLGSRLKLVKSIGFNDRKKFIIFSKRKLFYLIQLSFFNYIKGINIKKIIHFPSKNSNILFNVIISFD